MLALKGGGDSGDGGGFFRNFSFLSRLILMVSRLYLVFILLFATFSK